MGERQFSPGNVAGMLASAVLAVGYSLVALQHPFLFAPFDYAGHAFAFPFKEAGEQARAHLVVDSLLLLLGGGWYARSARRDG
jgi:hypothetical protein